MPPACTVCRHKRRTEIDKALLAGDESTRSIAKRVGGPSAAAILRHRNACLGRSVAAAAEARDVAYGASALEQIRATLDDLRRLAGLAETASDLRTAVSAVHGIPRAIELLAKLTGELRPEGAHLTVQVLTQVTPDQLAQIPAAVSWARRVRMALAAYPEALEAVERAMAGDGGVIEVRALKGAQEDGNE